MAGKRASSVNWSGAAFWNHPVLAGDRLLVRNDNVMVAFRLSLASR